jgi:hypothetical protein
MREKTMSEIRLDYTCQSRSTVTVAMSWDGGQTFDPVGTRVGLAATGPSAVSQAAVYVYGSSRYPCIEIQSGSTGIELERVTAMYRVRGR